MYTYFNDILCIEAARLYKDNNPILSKWEYHNLSLERSRKVNVIRTARGKGCPALWEFHTLPEDLKANIRARYGSELKVEEDNVLEQYLEYDEEAVNFFNDHTLPDGRSLSKERRQELITEAKIYKAITKYLLKATSTRSSMRMSNKGTWEVLCANVNALRDITDKHTNRPLYPHKLPSNWRKLKGSNNYTDRTKEGRSYARFMREGYSGLLHAGEGNDNSLKIKGDVADWLMAMYSMPIKMTVPQLLMKYDAIRLSEGWSKLTERSVNTWLHEPENERVWYLGRHGKEAFNKKYGHQVKRKTSDWFPNAYWAIDGSKLDWLHYADNDLKMAAQLKINVLVDVHSQVILGYSYSESETHVDHFKAVKMAVGRSGCKPYLFTYDNQSGHKSLRMQDLYSKLVATQGGTHYAHRPRAHTSPSEQIFSKLQQQVLNQLWFSDKQAVDVRSLDSKMNKDFIMKNKHLLKSKDELIKAWDYCVYLWNTGKHPRFKEKTREAVYSMEMPMREEVTLLDQIDMFWIWTPKPIKYNRAGLKVTISGTEFFYEVHDDQNRVDVDFRMKNVGRKFYVKYDPEHLNEFVQLYVEDEKGERQFVANAQPKHEHQQVPVLMQDGDKTAWSEDHQVRDIEFERTQARLKQIQTRAGITPEKLIEQQELEIKLGGDLPKEKRNKVESLSMMAIDAL